MKIFALKFTEPENEEERKEVINEANLIKILDCEQLINCEDIYEYSDRIWVILDYMEGGSLEEISNEKGG